MFLEKKITDQGKMSDILGMVTGFYQSVFELGPETLAQRILPEAAKVFKADIATWFLVTEDRTKLQLVDVYNNLGELIERPKIEPYDLNWEATEESQVRGLTAWVAISGAPLFVPSLERLETDHQDKSWEGKWDQWLYPAGTNDPETGFLCLYAVPLSLPIETTVNRERIVGVLKVERRKHHQVPFSDDELRAFDVIANIMGFAYIHSERQKSLTLVDIGHTLIRPLGDVASALDLVAGALTKDHSHELILIDAATKKLRSLSRILSIAKDGFNNPTEMVEIDLKIDFSAIFDAFPLLHNKKILNLSEINFDISISKRALAALLNIMVNLVENAIIWGENDFPIEIHHKIEDNNVLLTVESGGFPVEENILKESSMSQPDLAIFKGLPRSYQLAALNGWELTHAHNDKKNTFFLKMQLAHKIKGGAA